MDVNPIIEMLGRRLRLAVVGGGAARHDSARPGRCVQGGKAAEKDPGSRRSSSLEVRPGSRGSVSDHGRYRHPCPQPGSVRDRARGEPAGGRGRAYRAGPIVPGRLVDDFAGALLRFDNGVRGSFWVTQAAAGVENCLRLRVSGTQGTLEWMQEAPTQIAFKPLGAPAQTRTPNGPGTLPFSARASRIVAGHPAGFTRVSPTSIPTPQKRSPHAGPVRPSIRWRSTSPMPSMVFAGSPSSKRQSPRTPTTGASTTV